MGKRDRERRERGDFIVKHKPPTASEIVKTGGRLTHEMLLRLGIPHIWAMRRPLPPEETESNERGED